MIIWINGAFGSGKTQTAFELHRRIPGSYVYDPENVGYFLQKNIPKEIRKGDFQDYTMWREFNYSVLKHIQGTYDGTVIVPMTIVNPQFFDEIIGRLQSDGIRVDHYALCASKEMILKRLRSRGDGKNSWPAKQIDRCISALPDDKFRHHIDTEDKTIEEVADMIGQLSNITLIPDNRSAFSKRMSRALAQLKHIRLLSWRI